MADGVAKLLFRRFVKRESRGAGDGGYGDVFGLGRIILYRQNRGEEEAPRVSPTFDAWRFTGSPPPRGAWRGSI